MRISYLEENLSLHRSMQPIDVIKFCYQATFGPEHLLLDEKKASQYLKEEWESVDSVSSLPLIEKLSNRFCRINIAPWKEEGRKEEELFLLFRESTKTKKGTDSDFKRKMKSYQKILRQEWLDKKRKDLSLLLQDYYKDITPVSHSEYYRKKENPHYRVVSLEVLEKHSLL